MGKCCGNCLATHGSRNQKTANCIHKEIKVGLHDEPCGDYIAEGLYGNADKINSIKDIFNERMKEKETKFFKWAVFITSSALTVIGLIIAALK